MARLFISAAHKSSGKTTFSIGLCAALAARGLRVQSFKKGPDYIDPMWLTQATRRACVNLDFHTMSHVEILAKFAAHTTDSDIAIIEGNKGLYDGLDLDGSNSNAALAQRLQTPVVLVIDARGMTRGIAPLILGYQAFDPSIQIAGVVLNQLGGHRHERKLRQVIEHYTNVKVLGAIQRDESLSIVERHLGLIPSNEANAVTAKIDALAQRITAQTDLDALLAIAAAARPLSNPAPIVDLIPEAHTLRIGVARDSAFGFYYADDLATLAASGARLVFFNTMEDHQLPDIDALFIGGGFPETHMAALERNQAMRQAIANAIESGLPTYAECGGLMYLCRSIQWRNQKHVMAGVIPADIVMHDTPQGRGYVRLAPTAQLPWSIPLQANQSLAAHEFHYSSIENLPPTTQFAYRVLRGHGIDGKYDGIVYKNLLASYSHLRHTQQSPWVRYFIQFAQREKMHRQPKEIQS